MEKIQRCGVRERERDSERERRWIGDKRVRKRRRRQQSRRDTAIRAPAGQDVTCGEQEEETGQI